MPSRWYKHPALPTGAPPFQSCLCAKAEALPVRIGYGWGSRRMFIYAALYGCRLSQPFPVRYGPLLRDGRATLSATLLPSRVFHPVRRPRISSGLFRILHKSVDYMLALWHDGIGFRNKWLCWCRSVFAVVLEVLSGYANLVQMP